MKSKRKKQRKKAKRRNRAKFIADQKRRTEKGQIQNTSRPETNNGSHPACVNRKSKNENSQRNEKAQADKRDDIHGQHEDKIDAESQSSDSPDIIRSEITTIRHPIYHYISTVWFTPVSVVLSVLSILLSLYYGLKSISIEEHSILVADVNEVHVSNDLIVKHVETMNVKVEKLRQDQESGKKLIIQVIEDRNDGILNILTQLLINDERIIVAIANTAPNLDKPQLTVLKEPIPSPLKLNITNNSLVAVQLPKQYLFAPPSGLPKGSKFDPKTNILTWAPMFQKAGSYDIQFSAVSQPYSKTITIDVEDVPLSNWYKEWLNDMKDTDKVNYIEF